jgi:hypothetical protein
VPHDVDNRAEATQTNKRDKFSSFSIAVPVRTHFIGDSLSHLEHYVGTVHTYKHTIKLKLALDRSNFNTELKFFSSSRLT